MFSGAVPLSKQERFAQAMVQLQEDKDNFAKQLKKMSEDRVAVEDKLACLNVQYAALQVSEQCRLCSSSSISNITRIISLTLSILAYIDFQLCFM